MLGSVIDDHAIEPLVGVDDILGAIPGEVGDGQLDGLVGFVVGREGTVAIAEQDQDIAVGVADQQIELAIAQSDRQRVNPSASLGTA